MNKPLHFTDSNFQNEVLTSDIPVLVDFWAEWCVPCRFIAPVMEEIARDYQGKIKVGKVNVDENPAIAASYGISGIPTLLLYKDGQVVDRIVGAVPKKSVISVLDKHLQSGN